eukprot:CAMPEP_0113624108 /NCGR_PEP_ID=MMETSP0017_2-20120614/12421_1 /TAXON_ID=2856 /ORGANISM="Cylindrotheca closterium" /LENGTH=692 /DNA_ID=CAMNT_0000534115 /DNA_START=271 /DNA_END=2346 /DNA_ORIENTATION=+ /assembly_acc=CAM_ASM_000147
MNGMMSAPQQHHRGSPAHYGSPPSHAGPPPPMHQMGTTPPPPQALPPQVALAPPPQQMPPGVGGNPPPPDAIHAAPPEYVQQQMPPATPPAALPWTVGSTDGSFAMVTLMQQQQQFNWNGSSQGGVGIGAALGGAGGGGAGGAPVDGQATRNMAALGQIQSGKSLFHDKLFHQASSATESVLAASCDVMGFDIAEMWLRTGPKTHQLTNSHLRPTALEDSVRNELVDVYYGEKSSERTHRLSPALCKRAKDANDVVWVTAHTPHGAEALRCSISNVRTAVAVPVCHEASNSNITIIYFSIRRIIMKPAAVEFLVHMSLSAAVASVNSLAEECLVVDRNIDGGKQSKSISTSRSEHSAPTRTIIPHQRVSHTSITGARLDLKWRELTNVEYLTDGGNSWIHTSVYNEKPVVVKTLKPECQDVALAINEIEGELSIHSRLNHNNIVGLVGAGLTSKGVRFVVLERLDGGTLSQMLGYDTRIRDRRRRFWKKKQMPYLDVLNCARSLSVAMQYLHDKAIPNSIVLHRDLKPDNIGFTLDGTVKLLDFGLARILENADPKTNEVYTMSGETGSLRYMAPEVAEGHPYNHKADVYSFGIILWEMNAGKKPYHGLNREQFYEVVIHGGDRPPLNKKWPEALRSLISDCWDTDLDKRPDFSEVILRLDSLLSNEKDKSGGKAKGPLRRISGMIDRHSTW